MVFCQITLTTRSIWCDKTYSSVGFIITKNTVTSTQPTFLPWRFGLYQRPSWEEVCSIPLPVLATIVMRRGKKSVIHVAQRVAPLVYMIWFASQPSGQLAKSCSHVERLVVCCSDAVLTWLSWNTPTSAAVNIRCRCLTCIRRPSDLCRRPRPLTRMILTVTSMSYNGCYYYCHFCLTCLIMAALCSRCGHYIFAL